MASVLQSDQEGHSRPLRAWEGDSAVWVEGPVELIKQLVAPQHFLFLVVSQDLVTAAGQGAGAEISYLWTMR